MAAPHYHSPVRNAPKDSITHHDFWTSSNYEKLPYHRGFLFALYLDIQLKLTTPYSLTSYMQLLLAQSSTIHVQGIIDIELLGIICQITRFDPTQAYQQYIHQEQSIDFTHSAIPPSIQVRTMTDPIPLFEIAYTRKETFYQFMIR